MGETYRSGQVAQTAFSRIPQMQSQSSLSSTLSFRKECRGKGFEYNELIKEAIVAVLSCAEEESQAVARKEVRRIDEFEIQEIEYMEIISHWILPKLYYLEEKLKEAKGINLSKFVKHKATFIEKIKNGLRSVDGLRLFYEAALKTERRH